MTDSSAVSSPRLPACLRVCVLSCHVQSVVLSGGYEDDHDEGEWFLYTGSGGRDLSGNKRTNKVCVWVGGGGAQRTPSGSSSRAVLLRWLLLASTGT